MNHEGENLPRVTGLAAERAQNTHNHTSRDC